MQKNRENWHPPTYEQDDVRAIQAVAQGNATPEQQERALRWIIERAAATYDEPFRPGSGDTVAYMLGRRSVGLAIIKLMKLNHRIFEEASEHGDEHRDGGSDRNRGRTDRNRNYDRNNRKWRPKRGENFRAE